MDCKTLVSNVYEGTNDGSKNSLTLVVLFFLSTNLSCLKSIINNVEQLILAHTRLTYD